MKSPQKGEAMQILHECCCGLDVHKKSITACVLRLGQQKQIRRFGTTTREIQSLAEWLKQVGCTHVAMESTGVYWKPVYNILEGQFELLVVNAHHLKAVPGRKTDVLDAEWIAELLQHGLVKGSFVPPAFERQMRELTRYRTSLAKERARTSQRLQKLLESANIKLASVASDIQGVSAHAILRELAAGNTDPAILASLAKGRLRHKRAELEQALEGRVQAYHRFLIAELLGHLDYLEDSIQRLDLEIGDRFRPFEQDLQLADTVPGINMRTAEVVLSELGTDLTRFPKGANLGSWSGLCPGNNESAGKRRNGKTRKGNRWLRQALIEAAHGAAHTKDTYLASQYRRLAARRGHKKAAVALAHSILIIVYHVLKRRRPYQDLGSNYFDDRDKLAVQSRLVKRLQKLGYNVQLHPAA
jgi:transposase